MNIDKIIEKMSLKDKIAQLTQADYNPGNYEAMKEMVKKTPIGSVILVFNAWGGNAEGEGLSVDKINELQKIAMDTHGIPLMFGHDVIHGHKIILPIPLGLAATFNPELVKEGYSLVAREAKNDGINWTYAPMLDISRDPRWGRIIESSGEDPYLTGEIGKATSCGFQGDKDNMFMAACAKHYVGYGASEGGRDYHKAEISDYSLRNYYLKPFDEVVKSGIATVMNSFNEISGQPVASSKYLLTDVLRGEMGFDGFVISDFDAVMQLVRQGVAEDLKNAAALAVNAGLDVDMHDCCYLDNMEEAVRCGLVKEETLDTAVRRILEIKQKLGLFENPYFEAIDIDKNKLRSLSKELAKESFVLLKNDNNALPLKKDEKICVMGNMAKEERAICGSWVLDVDLNESVSIYDGIKEKGEDVSYYKYELPSNSMLPKLRNCETIVVAIGETHSFTGEANSLAEIEVPPYQREIIKFAKRTGKKVIGLLEFGRPVALSGVIDDLDAAIYMWHSGSKTGDAIAEILFGEASPSGKLPATLPRSTGQIPLYYNCPPSGRVCDEYYGIGNEYFVNYHDMDGSPLYAFGYGLSYTDFEYSKISCDKTELSLAELENGAKFKLSIDVTNVGDFDGKETVQLYVRDEFSSFTRPIKELKAFKKPIIKKGEKVTVDFEIGYKELGYFNPKEFNVEKGNFIIYIGTNCLSENSLTVTVK